MRLIRLGAAAAVFFCKDVPELLAFERLRAAPREAVVPEADSVGVVFLDE